MTVQEMAYRVVAAIHTEIGDFVPTDRTDIKNLTWREITFVSGGFDKALEILIADIKEMKIRHFVNFSDQWSIPTRVYHIANGYGITIRVEQYKNWALEDAPPYFTIDYMGYME